MTPYERAVADPAFLAAIAARYAGPGEVLDALHWLDDPEAPGVSGEPSPFAGIEQRRARLYQPGADPAEAADLARLIAVRDATVSAVNAALDGMEAAGSPGARDPDPTERPARVRGPRRAWPILAATPLVAAIAFLCGAAVGPSLGARPQPAPTVGPAQVPEPVVIQPGGEQNALGIFGRPQAPDDKPAVRPEGDLAGGTFRRLAFLAGPGVELYAARTSDAQVCLVAVTANAHLTASCASTADFQTAPCSIDVSVTKDPETDDPKDTRTEVAASWSFDGTLRAGAVS